MVTNPWHGRPRWVSAHTLGAFCLLFPLIMQANGPNSGDGVRADPAEIEEITVIAQRREQNLQTVPMTVDVLMRQEIDESRLVDLARVGRFTPNVDVRPDRRKLYAVGLDQRSRERVRRQRDRVPGALQALRERYERLHVSPRTDGRNHNSHFHPPVYCLTSIASDPVPTGRREQRRASCA